MGNPAPLSPPGEEDTLETTHQNNPIKRCVRDTFFGLFHIIKFFFVIPKAAIFAASADRWLDEEIASCKKCDLASKDFCVWHSIRAILSIICVLSTLIISGLHFLHPISLTLLATNILSIAYEIGRNKGIAKKKADPD